MSPAHPRPLVPIFADLVVAEDRCNLSCAYCLTCAGGGAPNTHIKGRIALSPKGERGARLRDLCGALARAGVTSLKLSGGEVLMHTGAFDLIEAVAPLFERLVLLTNGVFLGTKACARLHRLGNVVVQISLDSSIHEGNSHRLPARRPHDALVHRIADAFASGLAGEIYLVVNDRSVAHLPATVRYFAEAGGRARIVPFPVRGPDRAGYLAKDLGGLRELVGMAETFRTVLPHPAYLAELIAFHEQGERMLRCHLPRVAFSVFEDSVVGDCPNIWFDRRAVGSSPVAAVSGGALRPLLLAERPRLAACKACVTPWDVVSLFLGGRIPLLAVAELPGLSGPRTLARLKAVRDDEAGDGA